MRKSKNFSKRTTKPNKNAIKALSVATIAGLAMIGAASPACAEVDNRIIIDTIDQTVTGDYSNRINNNDWHADDWSSAWYDEWNVEGGVVKNTSQNLTIKDSTFDSNTLNVHNPNIVGDDSDPKWMSANGGIIGNTTDSSIKSIDNVTFSNNKTNATYGPQFVKGGVIGNSGTIESITNTKFTGNTSSASYQAMGGAIFNADTGVIDKISKSEFIGNKSGSGGAIYNDGTITSIDEVTIKNNNASTGGAIVNNGTITTISNSKIGNNKASSGSAIYNQGHIGTIDNTNVHDNTGSDSILNRGTIDLISNSKITGSSSTGINSIKADSSDTAHIGRIVNTEISNNKGYGINSFKSDIDELDGVIIKDNANSGIRLAGSGESHKIGSIKNSLFENNGRTGHNSALYLDVDSSLGDVSDTKFISNYGSSGGAISVNNRGYGISASIGNFTNVLFENNESSYAGGAIVFDSGDSSPLTVGKFKDITFKDNKAGQNAGALAVNGGVTLDDFENVTFEGNTAKGVGGAICVNDGRNTKFGNFTNVSFENNEAASGSAISAMAGGTFKDWKKVYFVDNKVTGNGGAGGVVSLNNATVGNWDTGVMQSADSDYRVLNGGGIYAGYSNFGNISNVAFKNLHAESAGGGIWNSSSTFGNFTDVSFENISASNGGGIWNHYGTIGNLTNVTFDKVGIESSSANNAGNGGVINNVSGTIGDWINGYAYGLGGADNNIASQGGAIWNNSQFGKITNVLIKDYYAKTGGAIWNMGTMKGLEKVSFINNHATESAGGAIMVHSDSSAFGSVSESLFQDNSAHTWGGAIASHGYLSSIIGSSFINNTAGNGGAIYSSNPNVGTLKDLTFIGNKAVGNNEARLAGAGGAIAVESSPNFTLEGQNKFINNSAQTRGGAILLSAGTFSDLGESYFEGNTSGSTGGAIHVYGSIDKANNSTFINNKTEGKEPADHSLTYSGGGAIFTSGEIKDISNSTFVGNEVTGMTSDTFNSGNGGAIFSFEDIENISNSEFNGNKAVNKGGAIWTSQRINSIENSTFANNKAGENGGALIAEEGIGTITNSSFINNTSTNGKGGAIYTTKDLKIVSKNGYNSLFTGNTAKIDGKVEQNAIYMETPEDEGDVTLTLDAQSSGRFVLNDTINGNSYNLKMTGDKTGEVYFNNKIVNANITQNNVISYVNDASQLNYNNNLAINSGIMNINNMGLAPLHLNSFVNDGTININSVDINPATETMGKITADSYGSQTGTINVNGLNVLADPNPDKLQTNVFFADSAFANTVKYNGSNEYMGKIYKYTVGYLPESGEFQFVRGGGSSGADSFNPSVLSSSVNAQAGTNATVNETFHYVFEHADAFTQLPSMDRFAKINENRYALSSDFNNNIPGFAPEFNNKAGWFRPYVTFEKMNLRNSGAVNATTYGSLVGFDSDFQDLKHGWTGVTTGYIGYTGSQLRYSGADTTMNGGLIGFTQTFYKGDFWTALTLSTGASAGQTNTMYGKEDFTTLFAGVGSKTGYNFEFKEGKYIIQPVWFMSYTMGKTFDYTNAAGVRIESSPMHSIMLNPSLRFIANTKSGWQPYASVGMVWNAMNESSTSANGIKLPESSIKPYVEYGVGLQKRFKDDFIAFGQAMIRNGGRNGISLTAGFRWAIGRDKEKPLEKVQGVNNKTIGSGTKAGDKTVSMKKFLPPTVSIKVGDSKVSHTTDGRKIVKQLSQAQREKLAKQYQNTTRTTSIGDMKKL